MEASNGSKEKDSQKLQCSGTGTGSGKSQKECDPNKVTSFSDNSLHFSFSVFQRMLVTH
jgi:hypothetical protein